MKPVVTTQLPQGASVLLAFGWRTAVQLRTTGRSGFVVHRERGRAAQLAGAALGLGLLTVVGGTAMAAPRDWDLAAVAGATTMLTGLVLCLAAQAAMGESWRIGVDPDERTALVTTGLFGRVRNPIFTAMLLFAGGSVLAVPTPVTVAGLVLAAAGIVAQVVLVEEPHLRWQHGAAFEQYVARTGRFLPRLRRRPARQGQHATPAGPGEPAGVLRKA